MHDAPPHDAAPLLLTEIGSLEVIPPGPIPGPAMATAGTTLAGAALLIEHGRIAWFGPAATAPHAPGARVVSAHGGTVIPGLIDAHTHIPFAGDRADEFARRLAGESYLDIMRAGGGIRTTMRAVRAATLDELVAENEPRLRAMLADGVTTVECKSGYGLDPEHELKQLRATAALAARVPLDLVPTYLAAHAVPPEYDGRPDEYIDAVSAPELLKRIADEHLAEFCDVFCDRGAFDVEQARRMLTRAAAAGLRPKLHADELAQIGASRLAAELRAVSVDHLEHVDDGALSALRAAGTVAMLLPGTSFFLGIAHAPARRLLEAGLPVALATDYTPGSCMIASLPLVMQIACCQLRLTPREVLVACTANAAAAVGRADSTGAIAPGYAADLVVLAAPTLNTWFYEVGRTRVAAVIRRGAVVSGALAPVATGV